MDKPWACTNCLKDNIGLNACTFCGAASPDNIAEHARTFNRHGGIRGLAEEIDALRAEVADLQAECDQWQRKLTEDAWPEIERLRAALEIAKGECEGYVLMQIEDVLAGHKRA